MANFKPIITLKCFIVKWFSYEKSDNIYLFSEPARSQAY